ncbi:MAG: DNA polymerase/3'-5' exonuclease PolX [Candidatus Thermoplasmatota archaeon]
MKNAEVSEIFYMIADILDILGEESPFKIRAYRIAAQTIETLDEDIENVVKEKRVTDIPHVGEGLAKKIIEIVETGGLKYLEELKKKIPEGVLELLEIPGLGPKKVLALYRELNIKSIDALREACEKGMLRSLDGFGEITERNILRGIQLKEKISGRSLLNVAYENGVKILDYMKKSPHVKECSLAGSLRRMKETIGDIDILVCSSSPKRVMDHFVGYPDIEHVISKGSTKTSVILQDNIQVDLRVVKKKSYGAALQYFTGSKEHNVALRSLAIRKGYKLSEYGLFNKKTGRYVTGENEEEVYKTLGLSYIEPELRENHGEIESAIKDELPELVGYNDIKGDLHIHSTWSDGTDSIETIVKHAEILGYSYVGVTDHSESLRVANGLSEERIRKKIAEIRKLNRKYPDISILCGTECDIKTDGRLDYSSKILKQFDFVYAAIHTGFKMNAKEMTSRIIKAMNHEEVDFIAHPTGRLIGSREPYNTDIDRVIETARDTGTGLEINAFPDRLDLNDTHIRIGKEKGVRFVIGTDAHAVNQLTFMRYGIAMARRGWLEKEDIINTYDLERMMKIIE